MDIRTRRFVYNVASGCRIRHSHQRHDTWLPVVRYDTAHGFAHRDRLRADGSSEKTPLLIEDYRQALNYAEADLKEHWQVYQAQYLKELERYEERE